jgi:CheY-like chemotaxis protein
MATILLVDDDPDMCRLLAAFLRMRGYVTLTALDGAEGLARVASSAPDAIITDVNMPGMDGIEMIRRLRADGHPGLPVLVYSALEGEAICHQARQAGAQAVLSKPAALRDVLGEVERLLAGGMGYASEVPGHGSALR